MMIAAASILISAVVVGLGFLWLPKLSLRRLQERKRLGRSPRYPRLLSLVAPSFAIVATIALYWLWFPNEEVVHLANLPRVHSSPKATVSRLRVNSSSTGLPPVPAASLPQTHANGDAIPKIVVQSYHRINKIPPKVYANIAQYGPGWKHLIFNDNNSTKFLKEHFGHDVAARFQNLTDGEHKADLFRYAFLYIHGGVWLDIDVEVRKPLDEIFNKTGGARTIYTAKSGVFHDIFQAILAARPREPFLKALVDEIVASDLNGHGLPFTVWFKKSMMKRTGKLELGLLPAEEVDFYIFRESCSPETTPECPYRDKYGKCCWVLDGEETVFKARYHDYPW